MKKIYWIQGSVAIGIIALLVFVVSQSKKFNLEQHDSFTQNLLKLKQRYTTLNQDVLQSRHKLLKSYDSLVVEVTDLTQLHQNLDRVPTFLEPIGQAKLRENLEIQGQKIQQIEELVDRFKSYNAILQNSLSYFPLLTSETLDYFAVRSSDRELENQLSMLMDSITLYQIIQSPEIKDKILTSLEFIIDYRNTNIEPDIEDKLDIIISHANVILENQKTVDSLVENILSMPTLELSDELLLLYDFYYARAIELNNQYRFYAYILTVIFVCGISYFMINQLSIAREVALEGSRLKSQFLANMSHEIRTPMNGILGIAELLLNTNLSKYQRESIETLQASANNLLAIINDILDLSKLDAKEMHLEQLDFNLESCLNNVVSLLKAQAEEKGICLETSIDVTVPRRLVGDIGRLCQVLMNLIGNAIKFTSSGSVTVRVSVNHDRIPTLISKNDDRPGEIDLKFQVRDTGIGIRSQDLPKLFQEFSQVDASTSRQYGGTGLGLAICQQLVTLMGGEIGVESKEKQGSTFWFTAKFQPSKAIGVALDRVSEREVSAAEPLNAASLQPMQPLEPQLEPNDSSAALKILVVEDNPVNRKVLLRQLQLLGYQADFATNGREAIEQLKQHDRDLVLMDCQMPVLDGYDATRELRNYERKTRHTVVIALTAHAMKGDREKCLEAGMDDYLTKPVNLETLKTKIDSWMGYLNPTASIPTSSVSDKSDLNANFINLARLDEISDGDVEFQQELLEMFVEDMTQKLVVLQQGIEARDLESIAHQAHTIKGASANLGIASMQEIALELEHQAKEDRLCNSQQQIARLDQILDRVQKLAIEISQRV